MFDQVPPSVTQGDFKYQLDSLRHYIRAKHGTGHGGLWWFPKAFPKNTEGEMQLLSLMLPACTYADRAPRSPVGSKSCAKGPGAAPRSEEYCTSTSQSSARHMISMQWTECNEKTLWLFDKGREDRPARCRLFSAETFDCNRARSKVPS